MAVFWVQLQHARRQNSWKPMGLRGSGQWGYLKASGAWWRASGAQVESQQGLETGFDKESNLSTRMPAGSVVKSSQKKKW